MILSCVEKLTCSACGKENLQVFYDGENYTGYCFTPDCVGYVPNPYKDGKYPEPIDPPDHTELLAEIDELSPLHVPTRKLKKDALAYFGCKVGYDQVHGDQPGVVFFPRGEGYKARSLHSKVMWCVGDHKKNREPLFGWDQAIASGSPKLFITEGEFDAIATYQMMKASAKGGKWEHLEPGVVSIHDGAATVKKALTSIKNKVGVFKEIILLFDMDEAGDAAAKIAMQIFPHAKRAMLPDEDPNACLIKGKSKAFMASVFNASKPKNSRIINLQDLAEKAKEPPVMGLSWPWKGLTKMTRGIRLGETIYIGGPVKMGKSEVVNALAAHFITEHNEKVFLAKPEEGNLHSVKLLAGKIAGKHFHDPEIEFDGKAYDKAIKTIADKCFLLNVYQQLTWESLKNDLMSARDEGVKFAFIDPITNLTNHLGHAEADVHLRALTQDLATLMQDLEMTAFIFCHLKAAENGDPHERGGKVYAHQFRGSRAMAEKCHMMLGLQGNNDPQLPPEERNMRELVLLHERQFNDIGTVKLYWNYKTGLFTEIE